MNTDQSTTIDKNLGSLEIIEYNATTTVLRLLREKYRELPDVATVEGMNVAKAGYAEIQTYRTALRETRDALKEPLAARMALILSEAKRIDDALAAIGLPIQTAIRMEEKRLAAEKAAKKQAEAERCAALEARIEALSTHVLEVAQQDAAAIRQALEAIRVFEPDPDEFFEFWPQAMKATAEARRSLEALLMQREALEARQADEEARLQAQWEELARQQVELQRQRAEEESQRQAEREELARLRALEAARQPMRPSQEHQPAKSTNETTAVASPVETDTRVRPASIKERKAKADPLASVKAAVTAGTLTPLEAIERAYQIGFKAGQQAAQKAA